MTTEHSNETTTTPRVLILDDNDRPGSISDTLDGIYGIARALHGSMFNDLSQDAQLIACALKELTRTVYCAQYSVPDDVEKKIERAIAAPDTEAEALSKKLRQRGLSLLEHTSSPGSYAVLESKQGTLQMQMNSIDGIEDWLERQQGGES